MIWWIKGFFIFPPFAASNRQLRFDIVDLHFYIYFILIDVIFILLILLICFCLFFVPCDLVIWSLLTYHDNKIDGKSGI